MKKLLALVLSLVMVLSLAVVGTNAAYNDASEINENYEEAIAVMSAIGVLEGDNTGNFLPGQKLDRQSAAKIIAYLQLGNKTASSLEGTGKFSDVPAGHWAGGYIEWMANAGITDGVGDGKFAPTEALSGFQFAKFLLGCLGYDANIEGMTGADWAINTSSLARLAGLFNGLGDIRGNETLTREQAAQMAFNAIKTPLVEYANKGGSITINGADIGINPSSYSYVTTTIAKQQYISNRTLTNTLNQQSIGVNQQINGNLYGGYTVEYGERYYPLLRCDAGEDPFRRPANKWTYDGKEVGTYVNYDKLVASYHEAVDGDTLYSLLGTIRDKNANDQVIEVSYFVDGFGGPNYLFSKADIAKYNDNEGATGTGVLTEVYRDYPNEEDIRIVSINTFFAKASNDYNTSKKILTMDIYNNGNSDDYATRNVNAEDVPQDISVYKADDALMVTWAWDGQKYNVQTVKTPAINPAAKITKFSKSGYLVTGGNEIDYSENIWLADPLKDYNQQALADKTYDIVLDEYGYVLAAVLHEGSANYLFLTGYDFNGSHLSVKTADAFAIFLDGTSAVIKVNVNDTDNNIAKSAAYAKGDYFTLRQWAGLAPINGTVQDNADHYNMWFKYSVSGEGANAVYTLSPVDNYLAVAAPAANQADLVVNPKNARLAGYTLSQYANGTVSYAYGNDNSVYLTAETDAVSAGQAEIGISSVGGPYTGIQNIDLKAYKKDSDNYPSQWYTNSTNPIVDDRGIFVCYDSNGYIIGCVILGEGANTTENFLYAVSAAQNEHVDEAGNYYWDFRAIVDGKLVTKTVKDKYANVIAGTGVSNMIADQIQIGRRAMFKYTADKDGYIIGATLIDDKAGDSYFTNTEFANVDARVNQNWYKDMKVYDVTYALEGDVTLKAIGNTLYTSENRDKDPGLTVASGAPVFVIQPVDGSRKTEEYGSLANAVNSLGDADLGRTGLQFEGIISAVLNSNGTAKWLVFKSSTNVVTRNANAGVTNTNAIHLNQDGTITSDLGIARGARVVLKQFVGTSNTNSSDGYQIVAEGTLNTEILASYDEVVNSYSLRNIVLGATGVNAIGDWVPGNSYIVEIGNLTSNPATMSAAANN